MEGAVERLPGFRIAGVGLAANEIGLPGRNGRDARDFLDLALRRHRIGGLGRRGHRHQVDLVADDQVLGDFGRTIGIGLAVADDDLDRVSLAADLQTVLHTVEKGLDDEIVRLAKRGERTGLRADEAELEARRSPDGRGEHSGPCRDPCSAGAFEHCPARNRIGGHRAFLHVVIFLAAVSRPSSSNCALGANAPSARPDRPDWRPLQRRHEHRRSPTRSPRTALQPPGQGPNHSPALSYCANSAHMFYYRSIEANARGLSRRPPRRGPLEERSVHEPARDRSRSRGRHGGRRPKRSATMT